MQAIRALAQYRPFEGGGESVKDAHEDIVLAALAEAGGRNPEGLPEAYEIARTEIASAIQ